MMWKFKNNLKLFEEDIALTEDFDTKNLLYLINNKTFFDNQYFVDSSWLKYFIERYKIDVTVLNDVMQEAIYKEDFNAVNILIDKNYIVSQKDLNVVKDRIESVQETIKEDKKDGYESYLVSESKIDRISALLNLKYISNKIQDHDGYTNLRKEKKSTSEILQRINAGEQIEVLDNTGDWFLVKTKEGKQGYVHKSRVKSQ